MISFGTNLAIALYLIGLLAFIFNGGHNLLMMVISLELILLSVGLLLVNLSFHLDDLLGSTIIALFTMGIVSVSFHSLISTSHRE